MDEDKRDLINQLATRAGMLMEDCSGTAISPQRHAEVELADILRDLEAQVGKMAALLEAARTLCE